MNISAKKLIALSLATGFITGAIPVSAVTTIVRGSEGLGQVSVSDLAFDDIAILSNNPFHPVIGFFNNLKGFFIKGPVQETSFRLGIAGRAAGDLRKLLDWAPDNTEALSTSLSQYQASLADLDVKLRMLQASDLGDDTERILNELTGRLLTQVRFVDDIRDSFEAPADQDVLATVDATLIGALQFIGTHLDKPESFGTRIANLVTERADAATTVRTAEVLVHLIAGISGDEAAQDLKVSILNARRALVADLARALAEESRQDQSTGPAMVAAKLAVVEESEKPTVADIIDRLADDELKAELSTTNASL